MDGIETNRIQIRWTAVPSGVMQGPKGDELRLKIVVAPSITKDASDGNAGEALFSDWPEIVRRDIASFRVFVGGREGKAVSEFEGRIEVGELVGAGVWSKAFPDLTVRPENAAPDPKSLLNVDDALGSSYDPVRTDNQLRARQLSRLVLSLMPSHTPEAFVAKAKVKDLVAMSESAISLQKPESYGEWAQVPAFLGVTGGPHGKSDDDRVMKLKRRNDFRLSSDGQTPSGVSQLLGRPFEQRNASGVKYHALGADGFHDCIMFHSRVRPLNEKEAPSSAAPECDFVERLGLIRQYPTLAEKLGLILDVRFPVHELLKSSSVDNGNLERGERRIWVVPNWKHKIIASSPGTLFDLDCKEKLFASSEMAPDGGTDPEHKNGHLNLRNGLWKLSTLDIDGAALKGIHASQAEIVPQFLSDLDGRLLHANYSSTRLFGIAESEIGERISFLDDTIFEDALKTLQGIGLPRRSIVRTTTQKRRGLEGPLQTIALNAHLEYFGSREQAVCLWTVHPADGKLPIEVNSSAAHRSPGIALIRRNADHSMHSSEQRLKEHFEQPNEPGMPVLVSSDLIIGYVPEIWAPPARDPNGKPKWYSVTCRDEVFPLLGRTAFRTDGIVTVAVGEANDAAPTNQNEQLPQGNVSPSLFSYSNQSLGAPNKFHSFGLKEDPEGSGRAPDSLRVELSPARGTLPLVRYSSISKQCFSYAVRCRAVDVAGNSRSLDRTQLGPEEVRQDTFVTRQEEVSPPRVLTDGRLDLTVNPGASLNLMVARQEGRCDTRIIIPPKVTADIALRYGKLVDGNLSSGHLPGVLFDEYAEVPNEPCIQPKGAVNGENPEMTPVFHCGNAANLKPGYYYFPDPACRYATFTLHTDFTSEAFNIAPIRVQVPFYSGRSWPNAEPIRLNLCSLAAGAVEPKMSASGNKVDIFLPVGWMGHVNVSAACVNEKDASAEFRNHFAATEIFESPDLLRSMFETLLGSEAGKVLTSLVALANNSGTSDDSTFLAKLKDIPFGVLQRAAHKILSPLEASYRAFAGTEERAAELLQVTVGHFTTLLTALASGSIDGRWTDFRNLLCGSLPLVTPPERIDLICATKTPLIAPILAVNGRSDFNFNTQPRKENEVSVNLRLKAIVDEKSTREVSVIASWPRLQDDPEFGDPKTVWDRIQFPTRQMQPPVTYEPTAIDWEHSLDLGTTAYRRVQYRVIGLSRFAQFYAEKRAEVLSLPGTNEVGIDHVSSARPRSPKVEYLVPTLTWVSTVRSHANVPKWRFESSAKFGIRIYLGRGWEYEELLGVVLLPTLGQYEVEELNAGRYPKIVPVTSVPAKLAGSVTEWGADPIVASNIPEDLPTAADLVGFHRIGAEHPLPELNGSAAIDESRDVSVAGFEPRWNKERQLWYCDIGMQRSPSYGCFIRLALCRYQPKSIKGHELSIPVLADFMQLRCGRIITVIRDPKDKEQRTLRVTVSQPAEDGQTPIAVKEIEPAVTNTFRLEIEQACATENGLVFGWIEDKTIVVDSESVAGDEVLFSWKVSWPNITGKRRLVIKEFERWMLLGDEQKKEVREREIFSAVLEV